MTASRARERPAADAQRGRIARRAAPGCTPPGSRTGTGGRPPGRCRRRGRRRARSPRASRTAAATPACASPGVIVDPHRARARLPSTATFVVVVFVVAAGVGLGLRLLALRLPASRPSPGTCAGQRRQLVAHDVAQRRRRHAAGEALRVRQLLGARGAAERQADLSLGRVDADDLGLQRLARLDELLRRPRCAPRRTRRRG